MEESSNVLVATHAKRAESRAKHLEKIKKATAEWPRRTSRRIKQLRSWQFSSFKLLPSHRKMMLEALIKRRFNVEQAEGEADVYISKLAKGVSGGVAVVSRDTDFLFIKNVAIMLEPRWNWKTRSIQFNVLEPRKIAARIDTSLSILQAAAVLGPNDYVRVPGYGFKTTLGTFAFW